VPSQAVGLSLQWARALGTRHALVAGFEAREVRGASDELVYAAGRPSSYVGAGGRERTYGLFAEDLFRVTPRLLLSAGVRLDRWRNFDALEAARPVAADRPTTINVFADRSESAFSPRASLLYKLGATSSVYASGYRAFRAPTLNELYRDFRVGDVLTLADENLRAERLAGGEAGVNFNSPGGRLSARGAFFWLEVTRPVANLTLSVTPNLITRQRRNLGRTRSRGFEAELEGRVSERWSLALGYQFTDARVVRFPANAALEGRLLPQTPRQQLTFRLDYTNPARLSFGLQGRAAGSQFDDDLNLFALDRLFTLDAFASRRLGDQLEAFLAAENLTGRRYQVGRTPLVTLGPPPTLRLGLRLRLGAR
jgi:outer membrane receptor protein involved in Fe transport